MSPPQLPRSVARKKILDEIKDLPFDYYQLYDVDPIRTFEIKKKYKIKITSLAQGVPVGGELDYLDDSTIVAAFNARRKFD